MPAQQARFLGSPAPSLAWPRDMGTPENGHFLAVFLPAPATTIPSQTITEPRLGEVRWGSQSCTAPRSLPGSGRGHHPADLTQELHVYFRHTHTQKATDCQKPAFRSAEVFPHTPAEKRKLLDLSAPCSICRPRMAASEKKRGKLPARRRRPGKAPRSPG